MCGEAAAACADGQFPPEAPLELIECLMRLLPDGQDPLRRAVEQITGLHRGRSASEAIKEPNAYLLFEFLVLPSFPWVAPGLPASSPNQAQGVKCKASVGG